MSVRPEYLKLLRSYLAGKNSAQIGEEEGVHPSLIASRIRRAANHVASLLPEEADEHPYYHAREARIGGVVIGEGLRSIYQHRDVYLAKLDLLEQEKPQGIEGFWAELPPKTKNSLVHAGVFSSLGIPSEMDLSKIRTMRLYHVMKIRGLGRESIEALARDLLRFGLVSPDGEGWWNELLDPPKSLAERQKQWFSKFKARFRCCPICGEAPRVDARGSEVEISCCVTMLRQKSDYLTLEERGQYDHSTNRYSEWLENKVLYSVSSEWNKRNMLRQFFSAEGEPLRDEYIEPCPI